MKNFFISFSKEDKDWAEWIARTLEEAGQTVWYQDWDFRGGNNFVVEMHEALKQSEQVIAVLSESYLQSEFTPSEWATAFAKDPRGKRRRLLPIRVKECEPDGLLAGIVYTDLVGLSESGAKAELLVMLRQDGRPSQAPRFPESNPGRDSGRVATNAKPFPGPVIAGNSAAPNLGPIVSRSCNREDQRDHFLEAFKSSVLDCPTYPQVYVVHGPMKERHKSLVMRFQETTIQKYANQFAKTKTAVTVWDCKWSYKIDVENAKQQLIELLICRSHQDDPSYLFDKQSHSADSFRGAMAPLGNSVVIIQHKIEAEKWTATTGQLIKTYLEFWDEVKKGADVPQFIIFLNVFYPASDAPVWKVWERLGDVGHWLHKRKISAELNAMCKLPGRQPGTPREAVFCLYTVLDELPRVGFSDLVKWFEEHNLGSNEVAWEKHSQNIFRNKGWRLKERKNMAEIETALDEFIEAMQVSSNEMTRMRIH